MALYFNGIPTSLDVEKLRDAFGVPVPGTVLTHEQIEAVLGQERTSCRYKTVLNSWRKKLERESNILFRALHGAGIEVLDSHGRVDVAGRTYKHGLRRIAKSADIAMRTDQTDLTPEEARVCEHLARTGSSLRLAAITAAKSFRSYQTKPDSSLKGARS